MRTGTEAKVPIIGSTLIRTTTHMRLIIEERAGELFQSQVTCKVENRPTRSIAKTVLPEAFIAHLIRKTYPIELTASDQGKWKYTADLQQQYVGYDGALAPDDIPRDAKHPAVFDWDEDGKPGASVLVDIPIIGEIRIYMVQTNHTILSGWVNEDGVIRGTATQRLLKQHTIGADNRLLAASPKLSVVSDHNAFEIMRIPAGSTCRDVKALAEGTF